MWEIYLKLNFLLSVNESVTDLFQNIKNKLNNTCSEKLFKNLNNDSYKIFFLYSSKSKNDLMPFFYCMDNNNNEAKYTYVVIKVYEFILKFIHSLLVL